MVDLSDPNPNPSLGLTLIDDTHLRLILELPETTSKETHLGYRPTDLMGIKMRVWKLNSDSPWAPSIAACQGIWAHICAKYRLTDVEDHSDWVNNDGLYSQLSFDFGCSREGGKSTVIRFVESYEHKGSSTEKLRDDFPGAFSEHEHVPPDGVEVITPNDARRLFSNWSKAAETFVRAFVRRHDIIRSNALADVNFADENKLSDQ